MYCSIPYNFVLYCLIVIVSVVLSNITFVPFYKIIFNFSRTLITFFTSIPLIIVHFFLQYIIFFFKKKLTLYLLKDKIIKIILFNNKFNITVNFLNSCNFLKEVSYLEMKVLVFTFWELKKHSIFYVNNTMYTL
jgi:hypothetical protein